MEPQKRTRSGYFSIILELPGDDDEEGWDDDDDDEEEDAEDLRHLGLGQVGRANDLDALRQHLQDLGAGRRVVGDALVVGPASEKDHFIALDRLCDNQAWKSPCEG